MVTKAELKKAVKTMGKSDNKKPEKPAEAL